MPERIAILGGGPAGLAAALELTDPGLGGRFEVTVYQQGWRLGGKCASSHNVAEHGRNEEHGLHVWFGFYENAFNVFGRVFAAHPAPPFPTIYDAFYERPYTVLGAGPPGNPSRWDVTFPAAPGRPADGSPVRTPDDIASFVMGLFFDLLEQGLAEARAAHPGLLAELAMGVTEVEVKAIEAVLRRVPAGRVVDALLQVANASGSLRVVDRLGDLFTDLFGGLVRRLPAVPQALTAADLVLAGLRGLLDPRDGALQKGDLDLLDKYELKSWLRDHGARQETVDSTFVRAIYECMFAYVNGDRTTASYAAGVALRVVLRIGMTYKGSVLYLPKGGFGELLIAPAYEVLKARGVRFEFFHRVTRLEPDARGRGIESVVCMRQADLLGPTYEPLFDAETPHGRIKAWPVEPDWAQLRNGADLEAAGVDFESYWCPTAAGTRVLQRGVDFDKVVLAIPVTALREVAAPLAAIRRRWRVMLDALRPVPNLAMQLWMDRTTAELGDWPRPPALDAGPPPFSVWTDMSETLRFEEWPADDAPRSVHYLCGVMQTDLHLRPASAASTPADALAQVRRQAIRFLEVDAYAYWPNAFGPGKIFRWDVLHAPAGARRLARLDAQYLRANVDPSEITHASPPGSTDLRLYAGDTGFDNLVCAGDWVRTGLNSAAVEGALMGGRQAARALIGATWPVSGEDWMSHPPKGAPTRLPAYVDRIGRGEQAMPAPGQMREARLTAFALPARRAQGLVDRYLNDVCGQPGRYVVDTDVVLLTFMSASMTSLAEPIGWLPDAECALWIPLRQGTRRIFWMPYVIVNVPIAAITGRETWGFAKEVGRIEVVPGMLRATGTVFDPLATTTEGREGDLVVARQISAPGPLGELISTVSAFAGAVAGSLIDELFGVPEPVVVNLKQFRDATEPDRACFQSIVESPFHIDDLKRGRVLAGEFEVRFPPHASHHIAADLGLDEVVVPTLVAEAVIDFTAKLGVEVWRWS